MSKSRRKKTSAAATEEASGSSDAPAAGPGNARTAPPLPASSNGRNNGGPKPSDASASNGPSKPAAASSYSRPANGAAAHAPTAAAAVPKAQNADAAAASDSTSGPRRRRGVGGGGDGGTEKQAAGGVSQRAAEPAGAVRGSTAPASSSKSASKSKNAPEHHRTAAGAAGAAAAVGQGGSDVLGRRRRRLWRALQWAMAVGAVLLALAAVNQRLIEEGPMTVSELLQEGLLGRLNVSLPPLALPLTLPPLPRPSLDALMASTGFNVSALVGLTDTLTDTLNDLTDTLAGARLTVTVRGLLAQLPAFGLPGGPLGTGPGGIAGSGGTQGTGLRPGQVMARRGYRARHPVVIVPGFVTSGLELWQGLPCGQRYFRQRMWGTLAMVQAFMTDPACWFRHMELDPESGLDPAGVKLRAAVGLEAVDYFIQGYWVWGKLVEALADVGYDSNSLVSMPYDWRLAMPLLEERDGYFTRLRLAIEALTEVNGERVVITAHSYGENVVRSFLTWVEADRPGWVEGRVATVVNIAGTVLGVPKSVSALLSGETRDTAQLGALAGFLTSNLVPRATRTRVWRTWGASYAMLPVGGPAVWGNASWAPDDSPDMRRERRTYGAMVSLWPHDWQNVLAAAATAPPHQREELSRLVHNVSESAEAGTDGAADAAADADANATTTSTAAAAAAAGAAAAARATLNGDSAAAEDQWQAGGNASSSSSSRNGSSSSCGSSSVGGGDGNGSSSSASSPMSRITDTLKRLVSSGGSEIDPANYLDSDHITRLDVGGFLALLREVGGSLVEAHSREWAAVEMELTGEAEAASATEATEASEASEASASSTSSSEADAGEEARRRATASADGDTPPARQALGGPRRLRQSVHRRIALFPDATRTPLPHAPSTAVLCLYGVGLPTERGYHYLRPPPPSAVAAAAPPPPPPSASEADAAAVGAASTADASSSPSPPPPHNASASGEEASPEGGSDASAGWMILTDVSDPGSKLDVGVQMSDGDGTVPLLSLGLMCRSGWRPGGRLNPGGSRVITREYKHRSVSMLQDARGGPANAAHIDILGNEGVLHDVIRAAAGRLDEMDDVIHSDIDRIAAAVQLFD